MKIISNIKLLRSCQCKYCAAPFNWTIDQEETIMGNRTVICPNCGMHIIVPFNKIKIDQDFEKLPILITDQGGVPSVPGVTPPGDDGTSA